jgi:hypothetical protein
VHLFEKKQHAVEFCLSGEDGWVVEVRICLNVLEIKGICG